MIRFIQILAIAAIIFSVTGHGLIGIGIDAFIAAFFLFRWLARKIIKSLHNKTVNDAYNDMVCAYHEAAHAVVAKHFDIPVTFMDLSCITTRHDKRTYNQKNMAHVGYAGMIGQSMMMSKFGLHLFNNMTNEEFAKKSAASDLEDIAKMNLTDQEKKEIYEKTSEILLDKWTRVEEVANILLAMKHLDVIDLMQLGFIDI